MKSGEFTASLTNYNRRPTLTVNIGHIPVGSDYPIRLQSMANTLTCDIGESVQQCIRLMEAGAEYVRFTVPSPRDVGCLEQIRKELSESGFNIPLIADVHFNPGIAIDAADVVEKVRINPGNYGNASQKPGEHQNVEEDTIGIHKRFRQLIKKCRARKTALRIGINQGSLSSRIMERYGDSPEGMAESAMEFLRICKEEGFDQVVVSLKSSNVLVMVQANRLIVNKMNEQDMHYPIHLGVTEAGEGEHGTIKSVAGMASLLTDGIGDTIRISLTGDPVSEIPVARKLVLHLIDIRNHEILPELDHILAGSFTQQKRTTREVRNIGGDNVPVVIADAGHHTALKKESLAVFGWKYSHHNENWSFSDEAADYIFADSLDMKIPIHDSKGLILPLYEWQKTEIPNSYPLYTSSMYLKYKPGSGDLHFIQAGAGDMNDMFVGLLKEDTAAVLVYVCDNLNVMAELRSVFHTLNDLNCHIPVVIRKKYHENDPEDFQIKSAADTGGTFIDGRGNGIWLSNSDNTDIHEIISTSFTILQACRVRISKTEYISCPSCGRTHFDLMTTASRIRGKTAHLKGLKIGIMGCIVNGPGEMADADYGYVGSGRGKVTLYKAKKIIKRNIPEDKAVDELINLIRDNGDWFDPA